MKKGTVHPAGTTEATYAFYVRKKVGLLSFVILNLKFEGFWDGFVAYDWCEVLLTYS